MSEKIISFPFGRDTLNFDTNGGNIDDICAWMRDGNELNNRWRIIQTLSSLVFLRSLRRQ
ncbi:MAG: hypothetical protein HN718_12000 [Rhodospirillales bacterium]|nr:hypothetical protein [Rhodospirillales bacterium]MBT7147232.1 hypothetical protein [Rhodospirillales bacterium]MBT7779238.1 hypothetical protein [Rhodospirillales bacterium]